MLNSNEIRELLKKCPQGYLKPDHVLFVESNMNLLQAYKKLGVINIKEDENFIESSNNSKNQIYCNTFGCRTVCDNIASYQSHYNVMHRFICSECKKSLPTEHLLDLHITEYHDSYFKARMERGECLFKCYLEGCNELFKNTQERKEHCIKHHKVPKNFRFDQISRRCSQQKDKSLEDISGHAKMEVEGDINTKSSENQGLKMFSFGHQREKTFCSQTRQKHRQNTDESLDDMNTLKQVLESM